MIMQNHFAIITPDHNDPNIIALKNYIVGYELNVCLNSRFASQFITEASIRKIFNSTSFYFLSENFLPLEEQIKMMTLGYMGFLRFPFSPFEVQNTIDLCETALKKIA